MFIASINTVSNASIHAVNKISPLIPYQKLRKSALLTIHSKFNQCKFKVHKNQRAKPHHFINNNRAEYIQSKLKNKLQSILRTQIGVTNDEKTQAKWRTSEWRSHVLPKICDCSDIVVTYIVHIIFYDENCVCVFYLFLEFFISTRGVVNIILRKDNKINRSHQKYVCSDYRQISESSVIHKHYFSHLDTEMYH